MVPGLTAETNLDVLPPLFPKLQALVRKLSPHEYTCCTAPSSHGWGSVCLAGMHTALVSGCFEGLWV